jgi:Winged helix DNA-binding domain
MPSRKTARSARAAAKAAADVLSPRALNRATLARQLLLRREKLKPVAAIERLLCLQAQIARPPFIALWSRLDPFQRADLLTPIDKRALVRATMMRATIHLMARQDYLAFRPVIQPVLSGGAERIFKDAVATYDVDKIVAAARACFDAKACNFAQLREHLLKQFPKLNERGMGYLVRMHLPLVLIPQSGTEWGYPAQADFAVAESYLSAPVKTDAAAHALALRYFAAFGPASIQDFQSWTGLGGMKSVIDDLRPKLRTFRDERGRELFDLPDAPRPSPDEEAPVRFLPEFDHVLLGYAERTRIVADAHRPALATKNLIVPAIFLLDGFVAGLWSVEVKKGVARLLITPLIALNKSVRAALTDEGGALIRFIEPDAKAHTVDFAQRV